MYKGTDLIDFGLPINSYAFYRVFMGRNVLEFFCVPLYAEFLSDLYEKFQVASVYDTNVEYQI